MPQFAENREVTQLALKMVSSGQDRLKCPLFDALKLVFSVKLARPPPPSASPRARVRLPTDHVHDKRPRVRSVLGASRCYVSGVPGEKRVLIIGLDCVPPALAFERWADAMPNLSAMRASGRWGALRSTDPPITVPAWASMASGRDPGELGLYGFRNRPRDRDYGLRVARSGDVKKHKRIWDRVGEAGRRVAALFVPLTSPPTPVRGTMVSCFLGGEGERWAFPASQEAALASRFGEYHRDVRDFRGGDLRRIFEELDAMREQHFAMARAVWAEQEPALMMMVEMGPDRLHHAAWAHMDPAHPRYVAGNEWEARARAYYTALDAEVGRLVEDAAGATVLVVSDHGARAALGGVALNELLIEAGWLTLRERPSVPTALRDVVDWSRTRAWAEGGYYARIFVNLQGREPRGVVAASALEEARAELTALFETLASGEPSISARVLRPEAIYAETRGEPPDLMVYLEGLSWRALGTVGHESKFVTADDALGDGPGLDGANHDPDGIVVAYGEGVTSGVMSEASILDVAPTVLARFGIAHDLRGLDLLG